jgi:L-alanine-DL-glutamate epimerase-like enolase superfamily enzyme
MRIASVEVVPYALPFREPYVTAAGSLTRREMVLLRVHSEDGLVGLGEAVPLSLRGGTSLATVAEELRRLGERDALDEASLRDDAPALSAPARCAALTALLDLRGKRAAAEERVSAGPSLPVRCNATLIAGDPVAVVSAVERWAAAGFSTFKLKLGAETAKTRVEPGFLRSRDDVGLVRAVREALGPRARIRVDANGAWDVETAKRTLSELEPYEIELAEQPVGTLEEAVEVAMSTSIPLAGDESIESRADAERAVAMEACRMTGVKLSKVGGPESAVEIAEILPAYLSSALDGPVGIAAAAQVATTLGVAPGGGPDLAHGLATQRLFASTIASVECSFEGDMLHLPEGPGLGVEIDEAALDAHRLDAR